MKILIADDHAFYRRSLIDALHSIDDTLEAIEASTYQSAEAAIVTHLPPLALFDLHMKEDAVGHRVDPELRLRSLQAKFPGLGVVVVSGEEDPATIGRILSTGLMGFISKAEEPESIMQGLRQVVSGGIHIPLRAVLDIGQDRVRAGTRASTLTDRQHVVARHLHLPNKSIAIALNIEPNTVDSHVAAIIQKLYARNRTHAALLYREAMGSAWTPGSGY